MENIIRSGISIDLQKKDLKGMNFDDAILISANLYSADLTKASLRRACLQYAHLTDAILTNAVLDYADMTRITMHEGQLKCASLISVKLRYARMSSINADNSDFTGTDFFGAYLVAMDFTSSKFIDADFRYTYLHRCDFENAPLINAKFNEADIRGAYFMSADLTGTDFTGCLYDANTKWPNNFDAKRFNMTEVPLVPPVNT